MRYLTPEELKSSHKDEAHSILEKSKSQLVRFNFGIELFNKCVTENFAGKKDIKILDLGSGAGSFARQLTNEGYGNIHGVDIDDYRSAEFKGLYRDFKKADLGWDKLPWDDNTFDAINAWCVLPHVENAFHAAREVVRVLKPGGIFIFSVPHITSKPAIDYFRQTKNFGHYKGENNHIIIFTYPILKKTILKYFSKVEIEYPVRPKVFERGLKGKVRSVLYPIINRYFPALARILRERWAYEMVFMARK